jgi:hypothetical protein
MKGSAGSPTSGSTAAIIGNYRKVTGGRLHFQPAEKAGRLPRFFCLFFYKKLKNIIQENNLYRKNED